MDSIVGESLKVSFVKPVVLNELFFISVLNHPPFWTNEMTLGLLRV